MGLTSLQVCMDSSDWFQGTIQDQETGMDSSSPSGITDPMLACSRPLMERRLRPQHDQALKCPRCDSAHTKFCYYNNYSLTQPRYFCKTCRRYWTKGGTLRNIPVGGGCRKNKKVSSAVKKLTAPNSNNNNNNNNNINNSSNDPHFINPSHNPNPGTYNHNHNHNHQMIMNSTDLQLSYNPESSMQYSASSLFGMGNSSTIPNFMFENLNSSNATRAIDFMENLGGNQYMGLMGNGGGYAAEIGGLGGQNYHNNGGNLCSPFGGMTLDSINNNNNNNNNLFMERGNLIAYTNSSHDHHHQGNDNNVNHDHIDTISSLDVKPKLLALEWQDHQSGSSSVGVGGGGGGYMSGGLGWYGPSMTNSLV